MEELFKMLDLMMGGGNMNSQKNKAETEAQVQKEIEGFKSLVTAEEREAVTEVQKAVDKLKEVHIKSALNIRDRITNSTAQSRVHYMLFLDLVKDLISTAHGLSTIDTVGLKTLAEVRIEQDTTYESMETSHLFNGMMKMFSRK